MNEDPKNYQTICKDCANARLQSWQEENKNLEIIPGMYVKIGRSDAGRTEHFWLEVIDCADPNHMIGRVDNDIRMLRNIHFDDQISFERAEIQAHIP